MGEIEQHSAAARDAFEALLDEAFAQLRGMPPVDRARLLGELPVALRVRCAELRAEAAYEATRGQSAAAVAAELGVSASAVANMINAHNLARRAAMEAVGEF